MPSPERTLNLGSYSTFTLIAGSYTADQCSAFTGSNPDAYTPSAGKILLRLEKTGTAKVTIEESAFFGTDFCHSGVSALKTGASITFRIQKS
jgi:hypothetical protein